MQTKTAKEKAEDLTPEETVLLKHMVKSQADQLREKFALLVELDKKFRLDAVGKLHGSDCACGYPCGSFGRCKEGKC